MSNWISSHQSLRRHPKVLKAAKTLSIEPAHMLGMLHFLWYSALDYAEDGNLAGYEDHQIAEWADWRKDPHKFIEALSKCGRDGEPGWIDDRDGGRYLVDWELIAGKLLERRKKDRERKRNSTEGRGNSDGIPQEVRGNGSEVRRNSTPTVHEKQNKEREQKGNPSDPSSDSDSDSLLGDEPPYLQGLPAMLWPIAQTIWDAYPVGFKGDPVEFKAAIRRLGASPSVLPPIMACLERAKRSEQWRKGHIEKAPKWLREGEFDRRFIELPLEGSDDLEPRAKRQIRSFIEYCGLLVTRGELSRDEWDLEPWERYAKERPQEFEATKADLLRKQAVSA